MQIQDSIDRVSGPLDEMVLRSSLQASQEEVTKSTLKPPYSHRMAIPASPSTVYINVLRPSASSTPQKIKSMTTNDRLKTLRELGENVVTYTPSNYSPREIPNRKYSDDQLIPRHLSSELISADELEKQSSINNHANGETVPGVVLASSFSTSFKVVKLDSCEATRGYFALKCKSYMSNLCTILEEETIHDSDAE